VAAEPEQLSPRPTPRLLLVGPRADLAPHAASGGRAEP
jgi:hypothetical protein